MARDKRFVAEHRGGLLPHEDHIRLATWAANCAESVLYLFERHSSDQRPQQAISIARQWVDGEVKTGVSMKASSAAHVAARSVSDPHAIAAARAAGHAVATAHFADHCLGGCLYAIKAMELAGLQSQAELSKQVDGLPPHLREQVIDGLKLRLKQLKITAIITACTSPIHIRW